MQHLRPAFAANPMRFGRRIARAREEAVTECASITGDLKLFAMTFLGGFVFISIWIG